MQCSFGSTRETYIVNSAPISIIQLCQFSNQCGQLIKVKISSVVLKVNQLKTLLFL